MITQELIDYIKTQQQQNVSNEIIKQNLLSRSWEERDIEQAFQQLAPSSTEEIILPQSLTPTQQEPIANQTISPQSLNPITQSTINQTQSTNLQALNYQPNQQSSQPTQKHVPISEAISFGWNKTKSHLGFFISLFFVMFLVQFIPSLLTELFKENQPILSIIFQILGSVLYLMISIGSIKITLDIYDNQKPHLSTLFSYSKVYLNYILASVLYSLIVTAGMFLLIVPGIIWAIKYQFFSYSVIDKNSKPTESLKLSAELTKNVKLSLCAFGFLLTIINIAGALALLVGLFITAPLSMLSVTYVYRKLLEQTQNSTTV
jgi:hypothetical protein